MSDTSTGRALVPADRQELLIWPPREQTGFREGLPVDGRTVELSRRPGFRPGMIVRR